MQGMTMGSNDVSLPPSGEILCMAPRTRWLPLFRGVFLHGHCQLDSNLIG